MTAGSRLLELPDIARDSRRRSTPETLTLPVAHPDPRGGRAAARRGAHRRRSRLRQPARDVRRDLARPRTRPPAWSPPARAPRVASAGPIAVSERALVLLSGADAGAGSSDLIMQASADATDAPRSSPLDDDRLSAAVVRRRGASARDRPGVRDRPLPSARRSVAGPGGPGAVPRRGGVRRGASSPRQRERRFDGVLAVGDRPARLAARVGEALGCRGTRRTPRSTRPNKLRARQRLRGRRPAAPWFVVVPGDGAADDVARDPQVSYPVRRQADRPVRQPRRDSRRHAGGVRRGVRAPPRAARAARRPRAARTRRGDQILVEGFIPGREFAIEGVLTDGGLQRARDLRQARSARRPVLRGDDLRHAVARSTSARQRAIAATRRAGGRARLGLRHGPVHAECRVGRATAWSCSKSPRVRSAACARACCGSYVARRPTPTDLAGGAAAAARARRGRGGVAARAGGGGGDDDSDSAPRHLRRVDGEERRARCRASRTCGSRRSRISCSSRCPKRAAISDSSSRGPRRRPRRREARARRARGCLSFVDRRRRSACAAV